MRRSIYVQHIPGGEIFAVEVDTVPGGQHVLRAAGPVYYGDIPGDAPADIIASADTADAIGNAAWLQGEMWSEVDVGEFTRLHDDWAPVWWAFRSAVSSDTAP